MTQEHYAFREIDRAVAMTKSILIPFDIGIWLRLALIALFAGGAAGGACSFHQAPSLSMISETGNSSAR
ncbi:hypothetical protein [Methanogenium cariaci]|uniref:DUF7544 domain-containing protein n=1 Tax=Methanogenium cariaci TaxID=2197 RepID=UPI0007829BED|nr:hypothetical protein [Methanogenium cariaci]